MATYIPLECYVCQKTFSGPIPAQDHFSSSEHNKRQKASKQELPGITCHVCNVNCNTMHDLDKHVKSPRHNANAEKQRKFQNFGNELTTGSLNYTELLGNTSEVYKFSLLGNLGYCYLCKCVFNSDVHAQSHLSGKPHRKRLAQYQEFMSSHSNIPHQNESNYSTRDQIKDSRIQMNDLSQSTSGGKSLGMAPNNSLRCEICGVSFTGRENSQQHYASDKHRKQVVLMEKRERGEVLPLKCDICNSSFTGQENAEAHFKSKKHLGNEANMKIRSETKHTGTHRSVNLTAPIPPLVIPKLETVVHQDDSPNLLELIASPKQVTEVHPKELPDLFKPVPAKNEESPINSTKPLFRHVEGNSNNSNNRNNDPEDTGRKSLPKAEISENLLMQPVKDQPLSNAEELHSDDEDELIVKPIEIEEDNRVNRAYHETENITVNVAQNKNERVVIRRINSEYETHEVDDDSLLVKPELDTQYNHTNIRCREGETEMFYSMSERKIKAETCSLQEPESCDFYSRDTEPVRYVKNDLGQSLASIGRGRGILAVLKQQEGNLPGKVENIDKQNNACISSSDRFDDSLTCKKSVWPERQSATRLDIEDSEKNLNENNHRTYNIQPHFNDSNDGYSTAASSSTHPFHENDVKRETVYSSMIEEEYVFDSATGRGKCYICDIDFTSSKHKSQHILGKNHLKARQVHRAVVKEGEKACGTLICKICSVTFSGPEAKQQHMQSEKHKRKEKRHLVGEENDYYCDICKISCSGPESFTQHMFGAQHRKLAGESNAYEPDLNVPNYDRTKWYPCKICRCSMNTYEQLKIHEKSPKHLILMEKLSGGIGGIQNHDRSQWFPCNVCNVSMNTYEQLRIHEQSPRHIKQLEKQSASGLPSSDRTQWFPCKICNVSMNTLEQLKIHEQSPRHVKQLGKQTESGSSSPHDRTMWYPCNVCKCSMNTREQLRIHEASPAHIAKLRKCNNIQQTTPSFAPSTQYTDLGMSPESATPLESFLSQELFPEEFLPPSVSTMTNNDTEALEDYFQEKLVVTDKPFNMAPRFALITQDQMDRDKTSSQNSGGTKRGTGSDLAFATRSRGTRENSKRQGGSSSLTDDSNSQDTKQMHGVSSQVVRDCPNQNQSTNVKKGPTENNPYAATHRYYCHTCKAPMNTKESYDNHVRGKRHMQKVCIEQAPQRVHHGPIKLSEDHMPYTKTNPRNYQQELYKKNMAGNTLCFLPTGTGKTLVSVMTMSAMLEKYPSKNVLFLVDKVLLVLQQSKYIKSELEDKEFYRYIPDSVDGLDMEQRKLAVAAVCMGQQTTNGIPLWKHDVVVLTAAFCQNLLDRQILKWEDFSLVVFDEAHHCEKGHPFNTLLASYHRKTLPENRPKVLGLTASPAGKIDVPKTLHMLRGLVSNMGDVRMTIVEEHENVDMLNEYQSNADMIIRPQLAQGDLIENGLRQELNTYIMHCLLKLYQVSNIKWYIDFGRVYAYTTDAQVRLVATDFVEKNFDVIQSSLNMIDNNMDSVIGKAAFYHLCMHVQSVCMALSCLDEGGVLIALSELEELESTEFNLSFARGLGLPTVPLQQTIARQGAGLGGRDENSPSSLHMNRLIDELTEGVYGGNDVRSISLVLVKQRSTAHSITKVLQKSDRMRKLGLNTTCVVGHGGSGAADKGMNVNQQKRVLEEIKQYQYQVIVATSVAEEGIDMPECERVISLYPPSTVTALVQMRGRARRKNSKFIVLCSSQDEEAKLYDIMQREKNMIAATHLLMQENRQMDNS